MSRGVDIEALTKRQDTEGRWGVAEGRVEVEEGGDISYVSLF